MSRIHWSKINSFLGNYTSNSLGYYRPCPICGSLDSKIVSEINDFQFYSDSVETPKRFDVRENRCLNCFTLYLNPCYSNYGFSVLFAEAGQSYGSTSEHTHEQIKWLSHHELLNEGARVLDVGCFDGYFLSRLPRNVKKLGVDIDVPAIERGRQQYSENEIEFFLGDFESFPYKGPAPDTITMFHVLEHLPKPVEVLKKLRSIANESTRLIVEVPVLKNGTTNDINGFFSIQHSTHFSSNSLCNCLALAGWKIKKTYEALDYNGHRVLAVPELEVPLDYSLNSELEDLDDLYAILEVWYSSMGDVEKIIQEIPDCDRIIIWGGGAHTEFLYQLTSLFHSHRQTQFAIVDSDPTKHGEGYVSAIHP
jgi:2-polyprenyl-3-methyl-5-hydroxy-6-metoxy-1,4-benzoquinol methylase